MAQVAVRLPADATTDATDATEDEMSTRTLTLGETTYPVTLPNVRDSRLHVAAVVITVHVLGQITLGFHVSVPQILSAVLTCAVLEVAITFRQTRAFVWPASAMLTGSGIALIMRVPSTPVGDHWTWHHWYVFAGVAGGSLLTKYVIRYRGSHVFNPSNVGLVVAFIALGSSRVEPLDFWWAPLDTGMVLAYAVIGIGGGMIIHRLGLLRAAVTFWLWFAAGIGVLAASGHCMIARWSFDPVCGFDYWRSIVTSPEILIFMMFMITDPKTVPTGKVSRTVFGFLVAVTCALLLAPQTSEFWSKVSLLGSLVILCPLRYALERVLPAPGSPDDDVRRFLLRLVAGRRAAGSPRRVALHLGLSFAVVLGLGAGVVAAGAPARGIVVPSGHDVLNRELDDIDPATLPTITVEQGVLDWNHEVSGKGAQEIVLTLVENLQIETRALLAHDETMLEAVDHGDRLDEMRARIRDAAESGSIAVQQYQIDDVNITLVVPFGKQSGLSLGLESTGTVTTQTYGVDGTLLSQSTAPLAQTFVLGRPFGSRWIDVAVLSTDTAAG